MYLGRIWKLTNKFSKFGEVWVVSKDKLWNVSTSFRHLILHLNFLEKSFHDRMHWWSGLLYIYCTRPVPASLLSSSPLWGGQNVASSSTLGPCSSWSTPFLAGRDSTAWFEQATREVWQLYRTVKLRWMYGCRGCCCCCCCWWNKEDVEENIKYLHLGGRSRIELGWWVC